MKIKYFFFKFSWKIFSFKLFPSSKIDFWLFLKLPKMDFVKLIYLILRDFLDWSFLNLLAHCVKLQQKWAKNP